MSFEQPRTKGCGPLCFAREMPFASNRAQRCANHEPMSEALFLAPAEDMGEFCPYFVRRGRGRESGNIIPVLAVFAPDNVRILALPSLERKSYNWVSAARVADGVIAFGEMKSVFVRVQE